MAQKLFEDTPFDKISWIGIPERLLNLAHCADRTVLPSVWEHGYYFPGGGIVYKIGVVVLVNVSPK